MTDESLQALYAQLVNDEGLRLSAYQDSRGYWTIGAGRMIDARKGGGITRDEALYLLRNDVAHFEQVLDTALPWWRGLDDARQRVLLDMVFNMGLGAPLRGGLLSFTSFLDFLQRGNFIDAAAAVLQSKWAQEVGTRALRLARIIVTGQAPLT